MTAPDLIPTETLFGTPEFSSAQISPDGRLVAYLAPWRGRLNIWVRPVGQGAARRLTGNVRAILTGLVGRLTLATFSSCRTARAMKTGTFVVWRWTEQIRRAGRHEAST